MSLNRAVLNSIASLLFPVYFFTLSIHSFQPFVFPLFIDFFIHSTFTRTISLALSPGYIHLCVFGPPFAVPDSGKMEKLRVHRHLTYEYISLWLFECVFYLPTKINILLGYCIGNYPFQGPYLSLFIPFVVSLCHSIFFLIAVVAYVFC